MSRCALRRKQEWTIGGELNCWHLTPPAANTFGSSAAGTIGEDAPTSRMIIIRKAPGKGIPISRFRPR